MLPDLVRGPWNLIVETGYTIALIGCVAALTRRVAFTPEKLKGKSQLEGKRHSAFDYDHHSNLILC